MNRLNHCPSIFEEYYRCGDVRLKEAAVLWCENMHDLSIWWGEDQYFGGTRYNNAVAAGENDHAGDDRFMWRTNGGRHTGIGSTGEQSNARTIGLQYDPALSSKFDGLCGCGQYSLSQTDVVL